MEIWKRIEGFQDYEISSLGRVRSYKGKEPIILKQRITHDGYVWFVLTLNGKGITKRANRLVAEAFIPNPDAKKTVNHIDGNKLNNSVDNLEWATLTEQMIHAYKHGLKKPMKGTASANHLLSNEDVQYIRRVYKGHDKVYGMNALAKRFNVSTSVIDLCVRKITYQNV